MTEQAERRRKDGAHWLSVAAVGPLRPLVLGLSAAVCGLLVAGAGLFQPASHDLTAVPAGDVALVNQEPILTSDFLDELQGTIGENYDQATPAQRAQVLHGMIDQELLVQRSLALDLPEQDTQVREALAEGVNNQVAAGSLANLPNEGALKAYFAAHQSNYASRGSMTLTDLLLRFGSAEDTDQSLQQALADASEAVYELRAGAALDTVMQHFGMVDSGKVSGDEIDFAAKLRLGSKLYAVAQTLSDGEISEPVADTDGVHVLVMMHRVAPIAADFDSVRNNVYADFTDAQKGEVGKENLKFLRSNAQILLAPGQTQ